MPNFPSDLTIALQNFIEENSEVADKFRLLVIETSLNSLKQLLESLLSLARTSGTDFALGKLNNALKVGVVKIQTILDLLVV